MNINCIQYLSLEALKQAIEEYCPIGEKTWNKLSQLCELVHLKKDQFFIRAGEIPTAFGFVYAGLLRAYVTDPNGNEYTKIFFAEGSFPGSMAALLTATPSIFSIEALEETDLLRIDFRSYRSLLKSADDLKWFQILYLEKNWLVEKERREIALVQQDATQRYLDFMEDHPALENRIPLYHIASHLGITPTQLSRIRKRLTKAQ